MNEIALKSLIDTHISSLGFDMRQPSHLYQPAAYFLALGGKRIRPALAMLAYEAISARPPAEALDIGVAIELFHNFTLIHDDIMDQAPLRRGKPSLHIAWDTDTAILTGDALFALSMEMMVAAFPRRAASLIIAYSRAAVLVCEGQMQDMQMAHAESISLNHYMEMIRKKTAVLLGASLKLGALAAGAKEVLAARLAAYGEWMGLGFQLQDDLMDAFPSENFGKQAGGDILEGKKTFLFLKAWELASAEQKTHMQAIAELKEPQKKVMEMLGLYQSLGIADHAQEQITVCYEEAAALGEKLAQEMDFFPISSYVAHVFKRSF